MKVGRELIKVDGERLIVQKVDFYVIMKLKRKGKWKKHGGYCKFKMRKINDKMVPNDGTEKEERKLSKKIEKVITPKKTIEERNLVIHRTS
jgi:hypothetical protein